MKKIAIILSLCIVGLQALKGQQYGWTDLFQNMPDTPGDTIYIGGEPYYGSYIDLFFVDDNEGWVTSTQQDENQEFLIFHTGDGGQNWEIQKHWNYSQAIWMLDAENGYLGDHDGFIMVTHNGGNTWEYHGATGGPVTDITFAPGSDTGYVSIDESYYFWQITPEGVNQIYIDHLNYWSGISATDETVWFCGGIQVFHWDLVPQTIVPELVNPCGYFGPVFFIDNDHGWIGNLCEIRGFVEYDYYWPLILSTDEDAITSLHAIDTSLLWATTFDGKIYHTSNAWDYGYIPETNFYWSNVVWEEQPHPKSGELLSTIQFTSPNCGYACGNNNTILKYTLLSDIKTQEDRSFGIYPNPTSGKFRISLKQPMEPPITTELIDISGKVVSRLTQEYHADSHFGFDVSEFPDGLYFCRIKSSQHIAIKKLIIQK